MVFGPSVFGEAWGTRAKKPHLFLKIVVSWPLYPRPPTNHLAKKPPRDPVGRGTWTRGQILYFNFSVPYIRSPEPIFVDLCSVFQAGAVGHVPGPDFGRTPAKKTAKLKYIF